ncbi:caspase-8-like [Dreissena polymorpha]|uniref:caspase-8-like n=1 Tax=Dreissena polymorpha TaxID=45954 RepID=UPI00226453BE|nr:caspase-8-like [Dreissena polymorpha]
MIETMAVELTTKDKLEKFKFSHEIQTDTLGNNDDGSVPALTSGEFHQRLININDEMGSDDIEALKFLCRDYLPASKLDKVESALEIFEYMKKAGMIDLNNVDFLLESFARIHRYDLINKLGFSSDDVRKVIPTFKQVPDFRVMLMDLADDVDKTEIEKVRFLLKSSIKKKMLNEQQSILQLFVLMEQEGLLGPTKLSLLQTVFTSLKRPELENRIREYEGAPPSQVQPPGMPPSPSGQSESRENIQPLRDFQREMRQGDPLRAPINMQQSNNQYTPQRPGLANMAPPEHPNHSFDRSQSAGTITVSSSAGDLAMGQENPRDIPEALFLQIVEDVKDRFEELLTELGCAREFFHYTQTYPSPQKRMQEFLQNWKEDKRVGEVVSTLGYALQRLGCKQDAMALRDWAESVQLQWQASTASAVPASPDLTDLLRDQKYMYNPVGPPELNEFVSLREAKPEIGTSESQTRHGGVAPPVLPPVTGNIPVINASQMPPRVQEQIRNSGVLQSRREPNQTAEGIREMGHIPGPQQQVAMATNPDQGQRSAQVATRGDGTTRLLQQFAATNLNVKNPSGELDAYKMDSNPRGWCVIINNQDFYTDPSDRDAQAMPPRMGTLKDAENLTYTFKKLGFVVQRYDNLTADEMMRTLVDASHNVDHSKFDCFVCCILTHGVLNHLYGANSRLISLKELTSCFQTNRCPTLAGKPKLFFLQACQGRDKMEAGEVPERDAPEPFNDVEVDTLPREMLPNEADFLLGYATVPGYVSFRSRNQGSWYIRKLCEYLGKYANKHHLLDILTEVNREVAKADANLDGGRYKQVPAPTYTLRKRLYLRPIQ